ncbi:ribonuclease-III-like-domain-containing protein [Gilbertella persicaria]|uniref:ribonuclease-III-like-domain-containing protein n=1 Tax=Gilbertella persicaria TaxID=101096 RepID=UPI00221F2692|nr:ribonuclease-III-like-domain-containing protein [Gilbertella persicaria]KAI8060418.1 ribonuclease-III-like-domain-containing protein [Gilbertella persicaria]
MSVFKHLVQRRTLHSTRTLNAEKPASFNTQALADQLQLSPATLTQALTHKSYKHGKVPTNERLQYVGRRSLEFFAMEANMSKNVDELSQAVKNVFKTEHLVARFDALGLEPGVRCNLPAGKVTTAVKSQAIEAIVGAVYHERGLNAAKEFAKKHVL